MFGLDKTMPNTFIDELESITDEVSAWGVKVVHEVVKALAPDNRGLGQEKLSIDEQLDKYRQIRNDPNAWTMWIQTKTAEITNTLINSRVSQETVSALNVPQLALMHAIDYSTRMEKELVKRMV